MADNGRGRGSGYGGPNGPGSGYFSGDSSSRGDGSSQLPLWALVLIMLASGVVTLVFLWMCVLFICRRRRARRAAVRDLEVQTAWDANAPVFAGEKKDVELKHCEANHVELTYVVMAGEDQPSFLARPAATDEKEAQARDDADEKAPPTTKVEVPLPSPPPLDEDVPVTRPKSPPSPSR